MGYCMDVALAISPVLCEHVLGVHIGANSTFLVAYTLRAKLSSTLAAYVDGTIM